MRGRLLVGFERYRLPHTLPFHLRVIAFEEVAEPLDFSFSRFSWTTSQE